MRLISVVLILVQSGASVSAAAEPGPIPGPVDLAAAAGKLRVYHDGRGHYLVVPFPPSTVTALSKYTFFGDGRTFYRQLVSGAGRMGETQMSLAINDPRVQHRGLSHFEYRQGKAFFVCDDRKEALTPLDDKAGAALIKGAKFLGVWWTRMPHRLARDDQGFYYLVDRLVPKMAMRDEIPRGLRVFYGRRGKMRRMKMRNVVADQRGEVFITGKGRLRLILGPADGSKAIEAYWISGKHKRKLVVLDVEHQATRQMIYRELGPYLGLKLNRPCDVW
jgi:hypothetical protein